MNIVLQELLEAEDDAPSGRKSAEVELKSLIDERGAVLSAVRRPGCWTCRKEAQEISGIFPRLASSSAPSAIPQLICVVLEDLEGEVRAFRKFCPGARIFLDKQRLIYQALGNNKLGVLDLFRPTTISNFKKSKSVKEGNMKGYGFLLGGVYVIDSRASKLLLEWKQTPTLPLPPVTDIEAAARTIHSH